jgi:hypothetical protein
LALISTLAMNSNALAQSPSGLSGASPAVPAFQNPEPSRYNLKWRNLIGRFQASVLTEATDNISLSDDDAQSDIGLGPNVGAGFLWAISDANVLQIDGGIGYRWYLEHPSISSVNVAPNSRFDYQVYFDHARISFYDNIAVEVDPTSRPDLSGTSDEDVANFRRLHNVAGLLGEWSVAENLALVGGYDYGLERSLTSQFNSIDRDSHTFRLGSFHDISSRWTVGLNSFYSLSSYVADVHNNSHSYGTGPTVVVKPSQFITIEGAVSYSISSYDSNGSVEDSADFSGLTGQLIVRHTLNSRMSHEIAFTHGVESALNSNFYELSSLRYGLSARVGRAINLNARVHYEHYSSSLDEKADRVGLHLGASYEFARRWQMQVGYGFNLKDSNLPGNDYLQNRVTMEFSRQF